jgi:hypothetical protein
LFWFLTRPQQSRVLLLFIKNLESC